MNEIKSKIDDIKKEYNGEEPNSEESKEETNNRYILADANPEAIRFERNNNKIHLTGLETNKAYSVNIRAGKQGDSGPDSEDHYKGWQAEIQINGKKIPIKDASFTIQAENREGKAAQEVKVTREMLANQVRNMNPADLIIPSKPDKSVSEYIEEALEKDEKPYPYAVTMDTSK